MNRIIVVLLACSAFGTCTANDWTIEIEEKDPEWSIKGIERNYWAPLTTREKQDISYIVKTLAYKSLAKVWKYRGILESAGDRVQHLHPFNFLFAIFDNEELKVGIRNVRKRGWIWGDFFNGLKSSLKDEEAKGNLSEEYVIDFAQKLNIKPDPILELIHEHQWLKLVDHLIDNVPRNGDTDRYSM